MLGRVGKVGRLGSIGGLEGIPAPDLQLNFDQASIGANAAPDDAIDFSRASQATFTDSDGLVKYAPHNLTLQSEDFSTSWTATRATVTANQTTAPDGTTTADKIADDGGSTGIGYVNQSFTFLNVPYAFSFYAKQNEFTSVIVYLVDSGGIVSESNVTFDISNGTVTSGSGDIESVGNGWFRLLVRGTPAAGSGSVRIILPSDTATTNSLFLWGAQLSQHKFVPVGNPYIKTTSAAVYGARLDHEAGYFLSANQAQNLILYSETIANASGGWLTTAATANSTDVPSGIGADNSTQITYSANAQVYNLVNNIVAGETYTFSYYVKLGTKSVNRYAVYDDTANVFVVSSAINTSASSSEWTRFSLTVTAPANCDQLRFYVDRADNSGEYETIFITGVQVEVGSTATTYNQTNGLEYYGGGATQNGLLIEEQRVNSVTHSEEFDNAAWLKSGGGGVTITANDILAPDGTTTADKIIANAVSGEHYADDTISFSAGTYSA